MIATVRGRVTTRGPDHVIVEAAGVGYKVFVPRQPATDEVLLHTHHVVREDGQFLYGFESRDELALFDMLTSVSGVGPKAAIVDLRGRVAAVADAGVPGSGPVDDEAAAALQSLGYSTAEAASALRGVPPASRATTEERVRAALKRPVRAG
ncbi:MAG: Holliday junction branch migration protein RuvA [Chloroflexi bacterium]|nr:Holliday junction branch migration protein RuvA [Chloroflexota bacterium]